MIRGLYTAGIAMRMRMAEQDVVANNLANANTVGYKGDKTILKSFPEMLLRRFNTDLTKGPKGIVIDDAPVIGKISTGLEVNEVATDHSQGQLEFTDNPTDFALFGKGYFTIETPQGERYTRNGEFHLDKDGYLVTNQGYRVLGENGYIQINEANYAVRKDGTIVYNVQYTGKGANRYQTVRELDKFKIRDFKFERGLKKIGENLYAETELSGKPEKVVAGLEVKQRFIERPNFNIVKQMVDMINLQRAYEASQKVVRTEDDLLGVAINDVGRIV